MATLVDLEEVKDNLPMKVPSAASDPLIQSYINQAEGRVTVYLQGLPEPGTDDAALMKSVVLDLATARTMLKLFGRDREMLENARELREGALQLLEAFQTGGHTAQETSSDEANEDLIEGAVDEDHIFDFSNLTKPEMAEE